jgi:hypothetical protein
MGMPNQPGYEGFALGYTQVIDQSASGCIFEY